MRCICSVKISVLGVTRIYRIRNESIRGKDHVEYFGDKYREWKCDENPNTPDLLSVPEKIKRKYL